MNSRRRRFPALRFLRVTLIALAVAVSMAATVALSVMHGSKPIPYETVRQALFHYDADNLDHLIVATSRLPRAAGALLIGSFLAVSGALMQGMTRNYLASPSIMGISDGSLFAVTVCMIIAPASSSLQLISVSLLGSAAGAALVFGIARLLPGGLSPVSLAVLGTIIGMFLSGSAQALSVYFQVSQNISFWYNARLHLLTPELLQVAAPFAAVGLTLALLMARPVSALSLGEESAAGLGLRVRTVKALTMLAVVVLTGASVALVGKIAFIGLVIPHIARYIAGQDYTRIVPLAAVLGALFLGWCDIAGRFLNPPFETPIGVVTALFGVPYFLYLIKTRGGGKHG